jgi:hypothetical protein
MAVNGKAHIYLGYDHRESVATEVAAHSIRRRSRSDLNLTYLDHLDLRKKKIYVRPWLIDRDGEYIDLIDNRPFTTEYSTSRFLVPFLNKFSGWALYADGDIIFLSDVNKLFDIADDKYAVMCVKHKIQSNQNTVNLDGRLKNQYFRKNWSSLVLWNCGHPSNRKLTAEKVNLSEGISMHGFVWLDSHEIGDIPESHNYISGVSTKVSSIDSIHFTEGGPWNRKDVPYSDIWIKEYEEWCRDADHGKFTELPKTIYDR